MTFSSCKSGTDDDKSNPFFSSYNTPFNVPPFDKIMAKHYMPAFEKGMAEGREAMEKIARNKETPTFSNTIAALDSCDEMLNRVSSVFFAQAESSTNDSLQSIEVEISPELSGYDDEKKLNPDLFKRIKYVYDNQAGEDLTEEQRFILDNLYKEYVRLGANLNKQDQDTLKKINQELSVLKVKYDQNVLAETNGYKLFVSADSLTGLPESLISSAAEVAKAAGKEGKYAFTTQRPNIFPFMQYSPYRDLRKKIFYAYTHRGDNGNEFDNNAILARIVSLRARRAKLLGYRSHADLVLEPRMAENPQNVSELLNNLWSKAVPVAKKEVTEMQKLIDKEGGKFKLEPADWWYYAEKLRKQKYDLDDNELRPYFSLENVRDGAFECANKLFGITITPLTGIPLPNPDALAYEVRDTDSTHMGILYMDFFPRNSKSQGAWCVTYRSHRIADGKVITPVVTNVFNFTRPDGEKPALLSLEEVTTLFHEFGHALDALMNRNTYNRTFVAWDFVELPSQLDEHWATEPEVLRMYAKNYKTGEPIPEVLIKKIQNSGYFNQGFDNVEILAASLLDMAYHSLEAPVNIDIQQYEKEFFTNLGLIPEIVSRYRSTYFTHITGGYDAGYYCYTWAAVLDNDAFEAFKEKGIFDKGTASSYRRNILQNNGIMDAMQMYVNFRGRKPEIEPLLKNRGLM